MAAYASLISLMRVIDDLEHHPSPPISLDKQLVDSITQRITYFEEFLHSYCSRSPVADDDEEVADPLEMRIAGAAFAAEDAIEYHIVDCINHKMNKKANDYEKKVPQVHDRSKTLVWSNGVLIEIMEKLAGGQLDFQFIPIVGMGGIGKTFLAKTIYANPRIKERFDICAWATISQHYDPGEILRELLSQATKTNKEQMSGKSVDQLGLDLYKYLFPRRFLIVMDDMCSIDSWDQIQRFFPNNYNGSRVLMTTRLSQLSLLLNNDYSLQMSFLDKASWDLFSKTVVGENSSCPPKLEEIGEKIVDNCRGLPLSISVVGNDHKKANDHEKVKSLNRCYGILQSVIEEMDSIKKVVEDTQKIKKVPLVHDQVGTTNVTASVADRSETFVGSDGILIEIMEKLDGGQLDFQVIPIVGMGGIGKTFLAKTIYTKPLIKERFDTCAWATISQNYDTREILCELLSQATKPHKEQHSGKSVDELGLELHKYLFGRRFLIVMDDMWSIDSWDQIQRFFPNNGNGSRVMVTTRLSQLSSQLTTDYSLNMSFLDKASSWDLFSKTVFGEKSSCPPELEEIGGKIVDNCKGLPLSISVVGGLLKNMDGTRPSWESIRDNFTSVVNMRNDKHCLRLLKLSYNHLPVYLKPCFLYMGVFEEDKRICVSTLVRQWVSEGFLKPTKGEALEITGRGFLQDLVGRNLILVDGLGYTGCIKFCKLHDLVRDMCLKEGQKEGFYHVMGKSNHPSPNAQRRVIILDNTLKENNVCGDLRFMSHTRSIICEYGKVPLCNNLVLLRTLQEKDKFSLACDEMKIGLNSVVSSYVNLRHLAIAASWMPPFLPSISHLWNLRTLVVSSSFGLKPILVVDFWEMTQLRHMNFITGSTCLPDPPSCDGQEGDEVVIMENLHTLKRITNFKFREGVVKRIPNIKKLVLQYIYYDIDLDDDDDVYFLGNMKYLCGLKSLSVSFFSPSRPFTPLQKITYPHSLKKLTLILDTGHEWDDMLEKIGSLPLLEKLRLRRGCFKKGKWEIGQGQFPCLKYLQMWYCKGLENWSAVEEDSSILPRLEHLHLDTLKELKKIPFELGNIDTLKSIKLVCCGEGAVKSLKEMLDEQVELQGGEDQLSFHVQVRVERKHQHLMSLASSNFYVSVLS